MFLDELTVAYLSELEESRLSAWLDLSDPRERWLWTEDRFRVSRHPSDPPRNPSDTQTWAKAMSRTSGSGVLLAVTSGTLLGRVPDDIWREKKNKNSQTCWRASMNKPVCSTRDQSDDRENHTDHHAEF